MVARGHGLNTDKNLFGKPTIQKVTLPLDRIFDNEEHQKKKTFYWIPERL